VAEIVLDHVSKRFPDGTVAVDDANLDIDDGEFVILVGPSGCGKSTCLNMIAGLEDISDGELRIGGRVVNQLAPKDRDIAMVFQSYALYPHMTVRDNMGSRSSWPGPTGPRSTARSGTRPSCWSSPTCWPASRPTCPAASASGSPWAGRSSAARRPS
jgi:ABC-type nitrate/sulfonate/bicarbonate transport system ATPase subunit